MSTRHCIRMSGLLGLLLLVPGADDQAQAQIACAMPVNGWGTRLLGTNENDGINSVHADGAACAVYVGGDTWGAIAGGGNAGLADAFVTRYGTLGGVAWTRQFGTSGNDSVESVATDSGGNVYVAGYTAGQLPGSPEANVGGLDAFLAKYDANGTLLWVHQLGTTADDKAHSVAVNANDKVFVAGEARGAFPGAIYTGGADAFLARYSANGTRDWIELYGTPADDAAHGVAIGPSGNVYLAGHTNDDMPYYTDPGFNPDYWHGGEDIFVGKYDPANGGLMWIRQRGTDQDDAAFALAVNDDGQVYVGGSTEGWLDGNVTHGLEDLVLLRYDSDGSWRWTAQRGTQGNDRGQAVAVDAAGAPFIAGYTYGDFDGQTYEGEADVVLLKFGKGGAWRWTRQIGTDESDRAAGIAIAFNYEYVVGFTNDALGGAVPLGGNDGFSLRYDGAGVRR